MTLSPPTATPARATTPRRRSRLTVLILCWLCLVADGYDLMVYGATLPGLIGLEPFRLTPDQGGHIASLALIGMLIGSLVAGTMTDRVGRRRIFVTSVALFSVGMALTAAAPTVELFVAARVLTCLGVGGLLPTAVALASEFSPSKGRSRTLGIVLTGPPTGMVLASFTASQWMGPHGFRPVYGAAAVMLLMVPVLMALLPESPAFLAARGRTAEAEKVRAEFDLESPAVAVVPGRTGVAELLRGRELVPTLLIWTATFFSLLTVFGLATWLPQVMARSGYGLGSAITFLLVYCLGAVIGTLLASTIADRIGPKPLVLVGFGVAATALLLISTQPATPVLVLLVLLAGFGGLGTQNVLNDFIARHYPVRNRASGLGWALGIGRLGAIAGPTYGAWVVAQSQPLTATALGFAATALAGGAVMAFLPATRTGEGVDAR